jgi:hypothetical protein
MTAPIALAVFLLATQQPITQPGAAAAAPHDPDPAAANHDAVEMLTTGTVDFAVLDARGKEHKASLVRVDGTDAVLRTHQGDYSIPVEQLRRFERPADRRWDGALIGFGAGLALAVLVEVAAAEVSLLSASANAQTTDASAAAISVICISTAVGYAIDAAHGRKHTLFVGTIPGTPATHSSALTIGTAGHPHDRGLQAGYRVTF